MDEEFGESVKEGGTRKVRSTVLCRSSSCVSTRLSSWASRLGNQGPQQHVLRNQDKPFYEIHNSKNAGENVEVAIEAEVQEMMGTKYSARPVLPSRSFDVTLAEIPKFSSFGHVLKVFFGKAGQHIKKMQHLYRCTIHAVEGPSALSFT